jgi:hypothetical protein
MLPPENSLTYFNDLIEHYRAVDRRIRSAPFKPKLAMPQAMPPAERPGVAPEPWSRNLRPKWRAAFAELGDDLVARILTPHPCTRIINETCLEHGISREEMIGPNRTMHIVRIRHLAMWRCRQAGVSLPERSAATSAEMAERPYNCAARGAENRS